MFETDHLIIHSITLRPDDVIDISYTEKRFMLDWACRTDTWSFDRSAIPDIEIDQVLESLDAIITMVEQKAQDQ